MSSNGKTRHRLFGSNDCDGAVVPATHISFDTSILIRHNSDTIRIDPLFTIGIKSEIDANEFPTPAQILNDAKTVAKIIRDK